MLKEFHGYEISNATDRDYSKSATNRDYSKRKTFYELFNLRVKLEIKESSY